MDIDLEEDSSDFFSEKSSEDKLTKIQRLGEELQEIDDSILEAENRIAELSKRRLAITRYDLPGVLDEVGMKEFTLSNGYTISVGDVISASLPKDPHEREFVFSWLRENNHDSIIKRTFKVPFEKGEDAKAEELKAFIENEIGVTVEDKADIHAATYKAFIKDLKRKEADPDNTVHPPFERMGVFEAREATIKAPKTKRLA